MGKHVSIRIENGLIYCKDISFAQLDQYLSEYKQGGKIMNAPEMTIKESMKTAEEIRKSIIEKRERESIRINSEQDKDSEFVAGKIIEDLEKDYMESPECTSMTRFYILSEKQRSYHWKIISILSNLGFDSEFTKNSRNEYGVSTTLSTEKTNEKRTEEEE